MPYVYSSYWNFCSEEKLATMLWQYLPVETVWRILFFVVAQAKVYLNDPRSVSTKHPRRYSVRGLAGYSMMCRYCAQIIRPVLFESIQLRGPDDVAQLLQMLTSPPITGLPLSQNLRTIVYAKLGGRIPPWLRLSAVLKHAPAAELYLHIDYCKPHYQTVDGDALLRCLPRTLPSSVFPRCAGISLEHVSFTSHADIIRLAHTTASAQSCIYSHFYAKTLFTITPPHTPSKRLLWAQAKKVELNFDFLLEPDIRSQIQLALTAAAVRERMMVQQSFWETVQRALITLGPFCVRKVEVDTSGEYYGSLSTVLQWYSTLYIHRPQIGALLLSALHSGSRKLRCDRSRSLDLFTSIRTPRGSQCQTSKSRNHYGDKGRTADEETGHSHADDR